MHCIYFITLPDNLSSNLKKNIAEYVAEQLASVPQCINASTDAISKKLRETKLEEDEAMISFDVVSLYTNVPVREAIEVCTDMLYRLSPEKRPNIDRHIQITS